jgi:hypothetical protein
LLVHFDVDGVLVYVLLVAGEFLSNIVEFAISPGHAASHLKVDVPLVVGIIGSSFVHEARQAFELVLFHFWSSEFLLASVTGPLRSLAVGIHVGFKGLRSREDCSASTVLGAKFLLCRVERAVVLVELIDGVARYFTRGLLALDGKLADLFRHYLVDWCPREAISRCIALLDMAFKVIPADHLPAT